MKPTVDVIRFRLDGLVYSWVGDERKPFGVKERRLNAWTCGPRGCGGDPEQHCPCGRFDPLMVAP